MAAAMQDEAPPEESSFPPPVIYSCNELITPGFQEFVRGKFKYIIIQKNTNAIDRVSIDKETPLLLAFDLPGAENGIYAWVLFDTGDGTEKQIGFKKTLNATEVMTKHTNIIEDLCLNKDSTDHSIRGSKRESIRVFFGGELYKSENDVYIINLLSGTYSYGRVDSAGFSAKFETELIVLFDKLLDSEVQPKIIIDRSNTTYITGDMGNEAEFKASLYTLIVAGVKIYEFPKDSKDFNRASLSFGAKYLAQVAVLGARKDRGHITTEQYADQLAALIKPLSDEELSRYLVKIPTGGGRKSRKRKGRKSVKNKRRRMTRRLRQFH